MPRVRSRVAGVVVGFVVAAVSGLWAAGRAPESQTDRTEEVELAMRVSPSQAMSPARVSAVAILEGEPDPQEEALLYCAQVEWDWGDGTRSDVARTCPPYEAGKTRAARRYTAQHTYNSPGRYRIDLRLIDEDRIVLSTYQDVLIRPGARFGG